MVQRQLHTRLMGSEFQLVLIADDGETADSILASGVEEIRRIEAIFTEFREDSLTALVNRHAGGELVVTDPEFYQLTERCKRLSSLTQGAFDITAGAVRGLYHFKERIPSLPAPELLAERLNLVGYDQLLLGAGNRVGLARKGMRIGFGAIGKGYAADRVRGLWKAAGVRSGVINASGDLTAWGTKMDGSPWKIGIADPLAPEKIMLWLPVSDLAVATSGNYEQYFEIDGTRYSHNIDPRTGKPVQTISSVTILSPSAELSDALATAVTVMGATAGLDLLEQLPGVYGIIVDDQGNIIQSRNIQSHTYA